MPNPIDLERFRDCSDGTPAGLQQLADMFLERMSEAAHALGPAVRDAQAEVIRTEAHRAAGAAGACGARVLGELLSRLEALGAERRLESTPAILGQFEQELTRVRRFLDAARDNGFSQE